MYVESEFWYVHSVEELVVWTVEREEGRVSLLQSHIFIIEVQYCMCVLCIYSFVRTHVPHLIQ